MSSGKRTTQKGLFMTARGEAKLLQQIEILSAKIERVAVVETKIEGYTESSKSNFDSIRSTLTKL